MTNRALAQRDFNSLCVYVADIVSKISGNKFGDKQMHMVESRLKKRMLDLGIETPEEYINHLHSNERSETDALISLLTTHHTFFFREFFHFEYLGQVLPRLISEIKKRGDKTLKILNLACSKGHEPYSLALFLTYHLKEIDPTIDFKILGTDIDKESVAYAENAVYRYNEITSIPMKYLGDHFARGKGDISDFVKVKDVIRKKCSFKPGNLLHLESELKGEMYDVVFCRNVFIYFSNDEISSISKSILKHLYPHGLFFTGISESLNNLNLGFHTYGASIYGHKEYQVVKGTTELPKPIEESVLTPKKLKVLCVDDSNTVLILMKKMFAGSQEFELVGTATNGEEAEAFLRTHEVDVMTLDIHMPVMDGLTYLEKNYKPNHPPVVIVSSASRSDSTHAMKALKLGASDFVEKPALNDIEERAEEIKTKLKTAYNFKNKGTLVSSVDKEFSTPLEFKDQEKKAYLAFASLVNMKSLEAFIKGLSKSSVQPPLIIATYGNYNVLPSFLEELKTKFYNFSFKLLDEVSSLEPDVIYLSDLKKDEDKIKNFLYTKKVVSMIFGGTDNTQEEAILRYPSDKLFVEDLGSATSRLKTRASDVVPVTSFPYLASQYFSKV